MSYLTINCGTSRGRDTYGYNIVSLLDTNTGRRYRCMGGGYDMQGTVLADWLTDTQQGKLLEIRDQEHYGMTHLGTGVMIDGACGLATVERIAAAAGIDVQEIRDPRNGRLIGFAAG